LSVLWRDQLVLIWTFFIIGEVREHLFICLLSTEISFSWELLLIILTVFELDWAYWFTGIKNTHSGYEFLNNIYIANTFSHSVACLFSFFRVKGPWLALTSWYIRRQKGNHIREASEARWRPRSFLSSEIWVYQALINIQPIK
jgi:hypothetical protein